MTRKARSGTQKAIIAFLYALLSSQAFADEIADGKFNFICSTRYLCGSYGDASKSCAAAGNFEKCVEIELGQDKNYVLSMMCNTDGSIKGELLSGFKQRGIEEETISIADMNCYAAYAELTAAETFGYRPSIYDSMLSWKNSLEWSTTPYIYGDILNFTDMGRQ